MWRKLPNFYSCRKQSICASCKVHYEWDKIASRYTASCGFSAYQLSIFGDATEDQFPGLFTFDFRYCFFSANRNGTFENSQNLVSIYQPTCGSDKSGRPEPEAVKFTREQVGHIHFFISQSVLLIWWFFPLTLCCGETVRAVNIFFVFCVPNVCYDGIVS